MHTALIGLQETLTNKWSTQAALDKRRLVVWEVASSSPEPGAAEPRAETRCPLYNPASFRVGRAWEAQVARPRRLHAPCRRLALQGLTAPVHRASVGGNPGSREREGSRFICAPRAATFARCQLGALAVMVAAFIPSGVGAESIERPLSPRLSVSRFIESLRTREAWAMLICRMQKGRLRFGEASTNPRPRLVRAGVTRVRQARPRARTAASHAISLGKQFTSQAGRPAWDWLPRSIGGSRMSQLHPHPRQPGVWPRPHGLIPPAPRPAVPLTHRAASAPPTVEARNVPGPARRGGATWCPREVPASAVPEGTNRRGRSVEEVKNPERVTNNFIDLIF